MEKSERERAERYGRWLRERLKAAGMSQTELARRAHLSNSYVSTLCRAVPHTATGQAVLPEAETSDRIAEALANNRADARTWRAEGRRLLGYASEESDSLENTNFALRTAFDELGPEDRELLLEFARVLARRRPVHHYDGYQTARIAHST